jgi:tripartite-type tricarboxylate transporter receptor subunit TctC
MRLHRRRVLQAGVAAALGAATAVRAQEDVWPSRPLKLFVVYPAGGVSDLVARALAAPLGALLGQPVVVEHRPGAGGAVGMAALARAAADGHTLAFSAITPLTLHPLVARVPYDPQADFLPIAGVMRTPVLVAGTPALAWRDFGAVLRGAQARPGALRWASSGVATTGHLVLAQVRRLARVDITHIPYPGGGRQLNDALAGQFELLSTNVAPLQLQYIAARQLWPLAVGAEARLDALPRVPTLAELGFADANVDSLFGIFAPARTPLDVAQRLNRAIGEVLAGTELRRILHDAYNAPADGSMADFAREIEEDDERNRQLMAGRSTLD